jgi:hypothetical protein
MPKRGTQQDLRNIEAIPPGMEPLAMVNAFDPDASQCALYSEASPE